VLQRLQAHPDRNQPHNRKALNAATQTVYSDLKKLETIAPRIKQRYEEYQERRRKQQEALKALEGRNLPQELDGLSIQDRASKRRSYDSRPALDAEEHHSLATRLAQREVRRRDTARRSVRQHGVSEDEEQQRRTGGRWESWQDDLGGDDRGELMNQLQEVARLQKNGHRTSQPPVNFRGCSLDNVTNTHSNRLLATHTPTTTRPYHTSQPKQTHMLAHNTATPTQHLHDRPRSKSTGPQAHPRYHHQSLPSPQPPIETPSSTPHAHRPYPESTQNLIPSRHPSQANSPTTAHSPPPPTSTTSPSSPPRTSKTAHPSAPSSSPRNCASNS
jgi:hypothetical protein